MKIVVAVLIALVCSVAVPMVAFAATDSGTSIVMQSGETIDVTITGSISDWALAVGTNEDTTSVDMNVKCNTAWNLTVVDNLDGSKPAGTEGKMAEYDTGTTAYVTSGEVMETAMQVKSSVTDTYVTLSSTAAQIESGTATPPAGNDYDIGTKQAVNYGDKHLTDTNRVYRIVVTFTGTATA